MKKDGFTLAEVLITLLIIGVVAALTIPSVIANAQQQEFKTGLKKAVNVLNEAMQMNITMEAETPYENQNLYEYLRRHMSVLKQGLDGTNNGGYFFHDNFIFYTTDGMRFEFPRANQGISYVLHETGISATPFYGNDGHGTAMPTGRCGSYGLLNNINKTDKTPCIILVDVNGDKGPNPNIVRTRYLTEWGNYDTRVSAENYIFPYPADKKLTDVFSIMITDEKAIPFGVVAQRAMYSK